MSDTSTEIKALVDTIVAESNKYYRGQATMPDAQWDHLVDKLRELDPNNIILKTVGWGSTVDHDEIPHPIVSVGGLPKYKTTPESIIRVKSATPKFDGASVELIYVNGKFTTAITRGNGETGQDCTRHLIPIVPNELIDSDNPFVNDMIHHVTVSISGEFILSKDNFEKYYPGEISHRNIAAGYLNRDNPDDNLSKRFSFMPYRINAIVTDDIRDYLTIGCITQHRSNLQNFLNKVFNVVIPYVDERMNSYESIMEEFTSVCNYYFDGIVVNNSDDINFTYNTDDNGIITFVFIYDEIAYKIITEYKDVIVTSIDWNLTRTNRYIPIIWYDPIIMSGATCTKATGHNAKYVIDNKIGVGAKIRITRSGEIIPYVLEVLEPAEVSDNMICPYCGSTLEWSGVDLTCPNKNCPSKDGHDLRHWISLIGWIDGVGGSLYEAIINYAGYVTVSDIYTKKVDWSDFINYPGIGQSKYDLAMKVIDKLHDSMSLMLFLMASNIKGLSETNSKKVAYNSNLKECLDSGSFENFSVDGVKGIGWSIYQSIMSNKDKLMNTYNLIKIKEPTPSTEVNSDSPKLKICVTGKLEYGTRSKLFRDFSDKIEESSITACEYLVTNNPNSGSSKNHEAQERGVQVITESQLFEILNTKEN